jgi:hypothetical protein
MIHKTYTGFINSLKPNQIFVYGQNTEGRNGKGAALKAMSFGAVYGKIGYVGKTYGIVTKDLRKRIHPSVSKEFIITQINELYYFALNNPDKEFLVAYSGIKPNLNGYSNLEMAEMFTQRTIPSNFVFEENFYKLICNILS